MTVARPVAVRAKRAKVRERVRAAVTSFDDMIGNQPAAATSIWRRAVRHRALIAVTLQTFLAQVPPRRRLIIMAPGFQDALVLDSILADERQAACLAS